MEANCDEFSQKHQKDLERIRRFRLLDDTLMTKVFGNPPCTELVLQIILDKPDLSVSHVICQYDIKNETLLGQLMHDFSCTSAQDMYFDTLARQVRYFKEDQKGVEIMCKEMEELREETKRETLLDSIRNLMSTANVSAEKAMDMLKINSAGRGFYMENLNK